MFNRIEIRLYWIDNIFISIDTFILIDTLFILSKENFYFTKENRNFHFTKENRENSFDRCNCLCKMINIRGKLGRRYCRRGWFARFRCTRIKFDPIRRYSLCHWNPIAYCDEGRPPRRRVVAHFARHFQFNHPREDSISRLPWRSEQEGEEGH